MEFDDTVCHEYENPKYLQIVTLCFAGTLFWYSLLWHIFAYNSEGVRLGKVETRLNDILVKLEETNRDLVKAEAAAKSEDVYRNWLAIGTLKDIVLSIAIKRRIIATRRANDDWLKYATQTEFRNACLRLDDSQSWQINARYPGTTYKWVNSIRPAGQPVIDSVRKQYTLSDWDSTTTVEVIIDFPECRPGQGSFEVVTKYLQLPPTAYPSQPRDADDIKWGSTLLLRHFMETPDLLVWHRLIEGKED